MQIYPAIDLQNHSCVRLYQGKFANSTLYSQDPVAMAEQFLAAGAQWLHIVDLDAAKNPAQNQYVFIAQIIQRVALKVQVGGGVRSAQQIEQLLACGAKRVIVGSQAVQQPQLVSQWLKQYGAEKIVLAFDIKIAEDNKAYICTHGWQQTTEHELEKTICFYLENGLRHLLCTDISKDGTLRGPNIALYQKILKQFPDLQLQASGGIACLQDLRELLAQKLAGAIVGRALYENKFTLEEALQC